MAVLARTLHAARRAPFGTPSSRGFNTPSTRVAARRHGARHAASLRPGSMMARHSLAATSKTTQLELPAEAGGFHLPMHLLPTVNPPSLSSHEGRVKTVLTQHDGVKLRFEEFARVEEQERALFVNDLGVPLRQLARWQRNLPDVQPFYAVKCNPDRLLLATMAENGASFDCASGAEIKAVLSLGVEPSRIIFANPVKNPQCLRLAHALGVRKMTFDNMDELDKIYRLCPDAQVVLRLLPDDSGSVMRFGSKFGADVNSVEELIVGCKERGMELIGVSFHIGSGCFDARKYDGALSMCRAAFDTAERIGVSKLWLVDVGGGFPGDTASREGDGQERPTTTPGDEGTPPPAFEDFAKVIRDSFTKHFPASDFPDLVKIGEPGRYLATGLSTLFLRVQGRREVKASPAVSGAPETPLKRFLYYVNDGVYGSFNCKVFDYYHPKPRTVEKYFSSMAKEPGSISGTFPGQEPQNLVVPPYNTAPATTVQTVVSEEVAGEECVGTFFGPTCDSLDKIVEDYPIRELGVGEYIVFENMGAYTSAAATEFNGCRFAEHTYIRSLLS